MTAASSDPPERRPSRRARGAAVTVAVLFAAGGAIYLARGRIAEDLARNWLREQGIASSLSVRSLSLTGLTASLRIGSAADPDLTVERVEVGYAVVGPWTGSPFGVRTRSLRLIRPRLKLRLEGGALRYGALQPLMNEASKRRPGGGPPPDIAVEQGVLVLMTPNGQGVFRGGGELKSGVLTSLGGSLDPYQISSADARLQGQGGEFDLHRSGERMSVTVDLGPVTARNGAAMLHAARAQLTGELPFPGRDGSWRGPVRLAVIGLGVAADTGALRATGGVLNADLDGALDANSTRQAVAGRLLITSQIAQAQQSDTRLHKASVQLDLAQVSLVHDPMSFSATGEGQASLEGGVNAAGAEAQVQTGPIQVRGVRLVAQDGRLTRAGTFEGALTGRGAFAADPARRLAGRVPVLSDEKPYALAMERALRSFRFAESRWRADLSGQGLRLAFAAPVRIDAASGAHLTLAAAPATVGPKGFAGGGQFVIEGDGLPSLRATLARASFTPAGFRADVTAVGELDAPFARGAQVRAEGRLADEAGRWRFDLAGCASENARRLALDPNPVEDFTATLCPGDGPLLAVGPNGWQARGRLERAQGTAPSFGARFAEADSAFQAAGRHGLETAEVTLDKAQLTDTAKPLRFRTLNVAGGAKLAGGAWTGDFTAATGSGRRIGKVDIQQAVATGVGRADIDTGPLSFAPNSLQPAELSPSADFLRGADGEAAFKGWFVWGRGGAARSGGELTTSDLKFKSPVGAVLGINTHLHFTSLSPLVTQPDQKLGVDLVQAVTPVSGLSAQFDLNAQAIRIGFASGDVATGHIRLEPTSASLSAGAPFKGVLVFDHVRIGDLIAASSLADSVKLDAVVDGRIPFTASSSGLTIERGELRAVGPGRLSISPKTLKGGGPSAQPGVAQDLAYQAMDNLAFESLDASLNTLPGERLGVLFHIKGRHDPPMPKRATIALGDLFRGKPLAKPLALPSDTKIDLTLDTSLNFGELVRALQKAWRESVGEGGSPPVQAGHDPVTVKKETEPR